MHPQRKQKLLIILFMLAGISLAVGLMLLALKENINLRKVDKEQLSIAFEMAFLSITLFTVEKSIPLGRVLLNRALPTVVETLLYLPSIFNLSSIFACKLTLSAEYALVTSSTSEKAIPSPLAPMSSLDK